MKLFVMTVSGALLMAGLFGAPSWGAAPDVAAGKSLAARTCAACHGLDGVSNPADNPSPLVVPDLAGQKVAYLTAQLRAFKDGSRPNPVMSSMANNLSDQDITNVAAYYASLARCGR